MQKIIRGKGFRGLLEYLIYRDDPIKAKGRVLGGNMDGDTPPELSSQFNTARHFRNNILNKPVEKPVWHNSLRLPKGETLSDEKWVEIADAYMKRMGFTDNHQRTYIQHNDKDGQHIHIIANRIALDGSLYLGKNENLISTRIIIDLEKEHGLSITKGPLLDPQTGKTVMPEIRKPKHDEIEMEVRLGQHDDLRLPIREQLQLNISQALSDQPTLKVMTRRLKKHGIKVRVNKASTGRIYGCSFELDGVSFKGSQLGDNFKWSRLVKQLATDDSLVPTPGMIQDPVLATKVPIPPGSTPAQREMDWTDRLAVQNALKTMIEQSSRECSNFKTFIDRLDQAGVAALPSGKSGVPQGMSFEHEGFTFKGSDLGYPWRNLSQLTTFSPQDVVIIDRLRKRKKDLNEGDGYGIVTPKPATVSKPSGAAVFMITRMRWYEWQKPFKQPEESLYGDWLWAKSGGKAFNTSQHAVKCYSLDDKAVRASMLVAINQFGSAQVTGTEEFKRKAWLLAQEMNLEISGYKPTGHDLLTAKSKQIVYKLKQSSTKPPRSSYERYRPPRPPASSFTQRDSSVQAMSPRPVDDSGSRSEVFLQNNPSEHMANRGNEPGQTLQRPDNGVNHHTDQYDDHSDLQPRP
ncbi:relaxase/mobilization nuclease domain-containing protein [Candidatus Methylospira mobilis]|uniref:relaxase/mobilization nuclease domain-containing protein n=1 Tax=Candidatus Methylospira mobilis TaxID=1808979 RepID=UPI0028E6260C|nr:relaxase/mobilization nuclease domain-containing protein [Candidatus Methylospira mobilis]WNV05853.1 relaxase/mobilization nuclease domain-containing protein [Candidatus Methylospira mobilis]